MTEKAILSAGLEDAYKKMSKFVSPDCVSSASGSAATPRPPLDPETTEMLKQYTDSMMNQVVGLLWKKFDGEGGQKS